MKPEVNSRSNQKRETTLAGLLTRPLYRSQRNRTAKQKRPSSRLEPLESRHLLTVELTSLIQVGPQGDSLDLPGVITSTNSAVINSDSQMIGFDPVARVQRVESAEVPAPTLASIESTVVELGFSGLDEFAQAVNSGDEITPAYIFSPDQRTLVTAHTSYPHRAVGRLWMNFNGSQSSCSGATIGPYHVLTAAHCIHQGNGGNWADEVVVSMGQDGNRISSNFRRSDDQWYGEARAVYYRTYTGWTANGNWDWDVALLTLDRNIGTTVGWLGYGWNSSNSFFDSPTMSTAGYPGDLTPSDFDQWELNNGDPTSYNITTHLLRSNTMDVWPGQSGSSNWYGGDASPTSYAVTSHQATSGGVPIYNASTRITQTKFEDFQAWRTEDNTVRPPTDKPELVDFDTWFDTNTGIISDTSPYVGESINVLARIRNNGTAPAGSFDVRFRLSTDANYDAVDTFLGDATVSSLGNFQWKSASLNAPIPSSVSPGSYYVVYTIDVSNDVSEFSSTYHTGSVGSLTVRTPQYNFASSSYSVAETDSTATSNIVTLTRTGPYLAESVNVNLTSGTAVAGADFASGPVTVNFAAGQSSASVPISILGENVVESDEHLALSLSGFSGPGQVGSTNPTSTLNITNDDSTSIVVNGLNLFEGDPSSSATTPFTFDVTLLDPVEDGLSVDIATDDGTATLAGFDYVANSTTLVFSGAAETITFAVDVNTDTNFEPDEFFNVLLSALSTASVDPSDISLINGIGNVFNDDAGHLQFRGTNDDDVIEILETPQIVEIWLNGQLSTYLPSTLLSLEVLGLGGNDTMTLLSGENTIPTVISGGHGDDTITGNEHANELLGKSGDDIINGLGGNDYIVGGIDDDTIDAGPGDDNVFGNAGRDSIKGGSGSDTIDGGIGYDTIRGGSGNDILIGNKGNDRLFGQAGNDILNGNAGNDILVGGSGVDTINGDFDADLLIGSSGVDILRGGLGADILIGGSTSIDNISGSLDLIMAEWKSTNGYNARVNNLRDGTGTVGGGANGTLYLPDVVLLPDADVDDVQGQGSRDYFWGDATEVGDLLGNEIVDP